MAVEKLACKSCGANLEFESGSQYIQCTYCGANNLINRNRAAPPPPVQVPTKAQINYSPKGTGLRNWLPYIGMMAAAGGLMYFSSHLQDRASTLLDSRLSTKSPQTAPDSAPDEVPPTARWTSDRPILVDIDGDGRRDLIGTGRRTFASGQTRVWAMSSKDWKLIWDFSLGPRSGLSGKPWLHWHPESQSLLIAIGSSLSAYSIKDGSPIWQRTVSDKIKKIFTKKDQLWVLSDDKAVHQLHLANGEAPPKAKAIPKDAKKMRHDNDFVIGEQREYLKIPGLRFKGLRLMSVLCDGQDLRQSPKDYFTWHCLHPTKIAFAHRRIGTHVPYLLRFDPKTKKEQWRVQLTPPGSLTVLDSTTTPTMEPDGAGALYVGLTMNNQKERLLRKISLRDGKTLWETPLNHNDGARLDGIVADGDRVYLVVGEGLVVLSADSGELLKLSGQYQKKLDEKESNKTNGRWKVR